MTGARSVLGMWTPDSVTTPRRSWWSIKHYSLLDHRAVHAGVARGSVTVPRIEPLQPASQVCHGEAGPSGLSVDSDRTSSMIISILRRNSFRKTKSMPGVHSLRLSLPPSLHLVTQYRALVGAASAYPFSCVFDGRDLGLCGWRCRLEFRNVFCRHVVPRPRFPPQLHCFCRTTSCQREAGIGAPVRILDGV
jgi:hypothetical protein